MLKIEDISLLIIAGGKSSRMGKDKRWLELNGQSFLERLLAKAVKAGFHSINICAERETEDIQELAKRYEFKLLLDANKEVGPMEGLRNGLSAAETKWSLAVSCDMPFYDFGAAEEMLVALDTKLSEDIPSPKGDWKQDIMAVVPTLPVDGKNRWQPLAAIYSRKLSTEFQAAIAARQLRPRAVVGNRAITVDFADSKYKNTFFNVNNPADYQLARCRAVNELRQVPLVTVAAPVSNTGKTTFIEKLIPLLRARNFQVGVVKSDAHGFVLKDVDVEGKDSYRFSQAGASTVAVVSPTGSVILKKHSVKPSLESLAQQFTNVDMVIIESRAHGVRPILSMWRGMGEPIINENVAGVFCSTDMRNDAILTCSLPKADINDIEFAAELTAFLIGR